MKGPKMIKPRRDERAELCQEYYEILILPLRYVAYRCGYCLAVHGSLKRDIDLVAAPWRDTAISAESMIEDIRKAAEAILGVATYGPGSPEKKDCGRLAFSIHLTYNGGNGPYLDISVMPVFRPEPEKGKKK